MHDENGYAFAKQRHEEELDRHKRQQAWEEEKRKANSRTESSRQKRKRAEKQYIANLIDDSDREIERQRAERAEYDYLVNQKFYDDNETFTKKIIEVKKEPNNKIKLEMLNALSVSVVGSEYYNKWKYCFVDIRNEMSLLYKKVLNDVFYDLENKKEPFEDKKVIIRIITTRFADLNKADEKHNMEWKSWFSKNEIKFFVNRIFNVYVDNGKVIPFVYLNIHKPTKECNEVADRFARINKGLDEALKEIHSNFDPAYSKLLNYEENIKRYHADGWIFAEENLNKIKLTRKKINNSAELREKEKQYNENQNKIKIANERRRREARIADQKRRAEKRKKQEEFNKKFMIFIVIFVIPLCLLYFLFS